MREEGYAKSLAHGFKMTLFIYFFDGLKDLKLQNYQSLDYTKREVINKRYW
jgi:hypothetical protein